MTILAFLLSSVLALGCNALPLAADLELSQPMVIRGDDNQKYLYNPEADPSAWDLTLAGGNIVGSDDNHQRKEAPVSGADDDGLLNLLHRDDPLSVAGGNVLKQAELTEEDMVPDNNEPCHSEWAEWSSESPCSFIGNL